MCRRPEPSRRYVVVQLLEGTEYIYSRSNSFNLKVWHLLRIAGLDTVSHMSDEPKKPTDSRNFVFVRGIHQEPQDVDKSDEENDPPGSPGSETIGSEDTYSSQSPRARDYETQMEDLYQEINIAIERLHAEEQLESTQVVIGTPIPMLPPPQLSGPDAPEEVPLCQACHGNRVNTISTVCGHLFYCTDCCNKRHDDRCPVCREWTEFICVYF